MPSPSALPLTGKLFGGETFSAFQRASDGAVMSGKAVRAHLRDIQERPARVVDKVDEEQEQAMMEFRRDLEETVKKGNRTGVLPIQDMEPEPEPEPEPELFTDREEASIPSAAVPTRDAKGAKGRGKRTTAHSSTNDQSQLPTLQIHFDDDGRRQTVRAHAAVLTQDGEGLMLLTPLAPEARYFPRPHSVVRITTRTLGERWAYCPRAGAHADFPGQGVSSYLLVSEEDATAFVREQRLAAARELLAQEGEEIE